MGLALKRLEWAQPKPNLPMDIGTASSMLLGSARWGDAGQMEFALRKDPDVNAKDDQGMTALHHAAARGARSCIRLLVGTGKCDYLIRDNYGRYAFELAIEGGRDMAVARLLLKKQIQQAGDMHLHAYVTRE